MREVDFPISSLIFERSDLEKVLELDFDNITSSTYNDKGLNKSDLFEFELSKLYFENVAFGKLIDEIIQKLENNQSVQGSRNKAVEYLIGYDKVSGTSSNMIYKLASY